MNIVDVIKNVLRDRGIKDSHIVEKAKINRSKVSKFLNKKGGLYPHELARILVVLNLKITDDKGNVLFGNDPRDLKDNTFEQEMSIENGAAKTS